MPPKKNKSTNKSQRRKGIVEEYAKDRASVRKEPPIGNKREVKKRRYEPLKNMVQNAEFSTILKEPGTDLQEDVCEESFNPPLHSTALYSDDEVLPERNEEYKEEAPKMAPPAVSKRNSNVSVKQSRILQKLAFRENSSTEPDAPVQKTRKMAQKQVTELESSENIDSQKVATEEEQQMSSTHSPPLEPAAKKMTQKTKPIHETQSSENNSSEVATEKEKQLFTPPEPAPNKMPQKPTSVEELESSANIDSQKVATEKEEEQQMSTTQSPPTEPAPRKKSTEKSKSADKKSTPNNKRPKKKNDQKNKVPLKIWSPEDRPRTARDLNELDVVLDEFEKLVEEYRESVDTNVCRKAVDRFSLSFKELLISSIKDVQILKDLKRKNAKVLQEIGRKQKRLFEIKDEIMKKQPRLNQLQKECSALEENQDSLKNANTFLGKLQQLQADCRKYKARHSDAKEVTYGMSSLPALLLGAQSTMRAEHHFHYVNTQLQSEMGKLTEIG